MHSLPTRVSCCVLRASYLAVIAMPRLATNQCEVVGIYQRNASALPTKLNPNHIHSRALLVSYSLAGVDTAVNRRIDADMDDAYIPRYFGDARDIAYVKRRLWVPRLCNVCWRPLWFVYAFVRLNPYAAVQIRCTRPECSGGLI